MEPDGLVLAWARAFVFTLVVEVPIYAGLSWKRAPLWHLVLAAAACTAVTHPLLWFVWARLVQDPTTAVVVGEILVAAVEGLLFFALVKRVTLPWALGTAFVANAASYGLGQLLRAVGVMF